MASSKTRLGLSSGILWWRSRINAEKLGDDGSIDTQTGDEYDIRACYDQARERKDPSRAPHLAFRKLKPGDLFAATSFLRRFGPLESPYEQRVNLDDFWSKHARFLAVAGLWEGFQKKACANCEARGFKYPSWPSQ